MEIENQINNNVEKESFWDNVIGKAINGALDIGLKVILPDLIEDEIIDIKDELIKNGFGAGAKTAMDALKKFVKSTEGIFTGKFESFEQIDTAVGDGGIIDTMSDLLENAIDRAYESGKIDNNVYKIMRQGKDILVESISNKVKNDVEKQVEAIEELFGHVTKWKQSYDNKDFEGMTEEFNKLNEILPKIDPNEEILQSTRKIDTIQNLIKNNGQKFELTTQEKELVEKL